MKHNQCKLKQKIKKEQQMENSKIQGKVFQEIHLLSWTCFIKCSGSKERRKPSSDKYNTWKIFLFGFYFGVNKVKFFINAINSGAHRWSNVAAVFINGFILVVFYAFTRLIAATQNEQTKKNCPITLKARRKMFLGFPGLLTQAERDCNLIGVKTQPCSLSMAGLRTVVPPSAPPAELTWGRLVTELAASSPHPGLAWSKNKK